MKTRACIRHARLHAGKLASRAPLLVAAVLPAYGAGCATLKAMSVGGSVTEAEIAERNKALDAAVSGLAACNPKSKPGDVGLLGVSAAANGTITVDATQWWGSAEALECLKTETAKLHLAAYGGPVVSDVWAIGTAESPAPAPITEPPPAMKEKLAANLALAAEVDTGPVAACAQQNLPNEAYAVAKFRVFVLADGSVAGATPVGALGLGRDAGFVDCVRGWIREWKFPRIADKGFTVADIAVQRGVDAMNK